MINASGDRYANYSDLIIAHCIHGSKHHIITPKYVQITMCQFRIFKFFLNKRNWPRKACLGWLFQKTAKICFAFKLLVGSLCLCHAGPSSSVTAECAQWSNAWKAIEASSRLGLEQQPVGLRLQAELLETKLVMPSKAVDCLSYLGILGGIKLAWQAQKTKQAGKCSWVFPVLAHQGYRWLHVSSWWHGNSSLFNKEDDIIDNIIS